MGTSLVQVDGQINPSIQTLGTQDLLQGKGKPLQEKNQKQPAGNKDFHPRTKSPPTEDIGTQTNITLTDELIKMFNQTQ